MKYLLLLLLVFQSFRFVGQETSLPSELYPQFEQCESADYTSRQSCFRSTLISEILSRFKMPEIVQKEQYRGEITVIFEVNENGDFELIYQDAAYDELKEEMKRVFEQLPKVIPATYNGRAIHMQFKTVVKIPLGRNAKAEDVVVSEQQISGDTEEENKVETIQPEKEKSLDEYSEIKSDDFSNPRYESQINIPLSHEFYSRFDAEINRVGANFHSASKPLMFEEVNKYYDFKEHRREMLKAKSSWGGRKLWNEHLVRFQTDDYWFTLDPAVDLQLGKDFNDEEHDFTYNNTRAAIIQGGLGKKFNFYSVIYENQGRFADYYNRYAESIRPAGGDPAIIPGRGIAKTFMNDGYDYPVAEGYLSFTPSKFINIQFGHGKNFIGDGYRSLDLK